MKNARLKKQLMSIGIQRNDAAAFIRCYRKIQRSDKAALFRVIMNRDMPIQPKIINLVPRTLTVEAAFTEDQLYSVKREDVEPMVREELSRQMADALLDSGAVMHTRGKDWLGNTRFRAMLHVIMPGDYRG